MGDIEQPEAIEAQPETPETPEAEQPETPEKPETDAANADTEEAPEAPAVAAPVEDAAEAEKAERKRAGGWQRKIERLERENEALHQQLSSRTAPPAPPAKEKKPEDQVQEYISSQVRQQLEVERAKEQRARAQADFQRRTAEVRASHPDFDEVVLSADVPVSAAISEALLTSEHGPAIMYQLASNPAELARISALQPFEAAREIGRLEAKTASVTPAPKTPKTAARPPAPPTNVGGSKASTRSLEDLPIADYKRAFRSKGR